MLLMIFKCFFACHSWDFQKYMNKFIEISEHVLSCNLLQFRCENSNVSVLFQVLSFIHIFRKLSLHFQIGFL